MTAQIFTLANQLTLLRMLLIPAFVLLVVYGYFGWALIVFLTAGVTDALDGLIARVAHQKTDLGAWLDPAADKLLLVAAFIVLTLPNLGLVNRIPIWLTIVCGIVGVVIGYGWLGGTGGIDWLAFIVSIVFAAILVMIAAAVTGRSTKRA